MAISVVHIVENDFSGAGREACRIHKSLMALGVHSSVLVRRGSASTSVHIHTLRSTRRYALAQVWKNVKLSMYKSVLPDTFTYFSDDRIGFDISDHPLVREADIIHLHWITDFVDYTSFFRAIRGKRIIWTLHDCNAFLGGWHLLTDQQGYEQCLCERRSSHLLRSFMRSWLRGISRRMEQAFAGQRMHIVAPSLWMFKNVGLEQSLLRSFPKCHIPHGVDTTIFLPRPKDLARLRWKLPSDKTLLCFGSEYDAVNKGGKCFEKALSILSQERTLIDVGIIVFGRATFNLSGISLPLYKLGMIYNEEEMSHCMSAADVTVVPSFEENCSLTVMESLACGTPVIASAVGGLPEQVQNGENGFLFPVCNAQELAARVGAFLDLSAHQREAMRARARESILQRFTAEKTGKEYLRLYEEVMSEES